MKRKNHILTTAIIALVVLFTAIDNGLAQNRGGGPGDGHGRGHLNAPFWSELTEDQKAELQTLREAMRDEGASREEIREAVHAKLDEWGIEFPEHPNVIDRLGDQLTEEQKAELEVLIQTMKDGGASRREIRDAVHAKLDEWGIELPKRGEHRRLHGLGDQLNEAQREELHALVRQMKEDGATREVIRDAVHAKLEAWRIECQGHGPGHDRGGNHRPRGENRSARGANHPNPFNPETTITYDLQQPGNVTVSIYNAQGQLVRTLDAGHQQAGPFQIKWNGKSDAGLTVPSGMYVYKIQTGQEEFTGRMLMMK